MNKSKNSTKIPERDLCQTPGYGIEPLLHGIDSFKPLKLTDLVWECAAGEGILAEALSQKAVVLQTDEKWDFIDDNKKDFIFIPGNRVPTHIITNPPFSKKYKFLRRALGYREMYNLKVAFLLQTEIVSTKAFYNIVREFGKPGIIYFNPRIDFKMPNKGWKGSGSHFSTAWFTWGWFEGNVFLRMKHWNKKYKEKFHT